MSVEKKIHEAEDMPFGMKQLLTSITHLKENEKVLVITDDNTKDIGEFVYKHASRFFETTMICMKQRTNHGEEPPEAVSKAMQNCDVAFGATTMSMFHTKARIESSKLGRMRWVGMQDYEFSMFEKGGLTANFDEIEAEINRVAEHFQGETFRLTSVGGTDMTCSVRGRSPVFDYGTSRKPGSASFPPNAEVALGPVEGTANGILVFDGSIPHPLINVLKEPVICKVEDGNITEITGGKEANILEGILAGYNDPTVYNVAELGLGLNRKNVICGRMAPDEGSYGNIHIGIGKNLNFGGHVDSPLHLDLLIRTVTIEIDGRLIMKEGNLQV
ncbi:aminopeptidase [Pseudogracilibacillus sp. SO10305]|uniref:aminopeptidase n=1 Tax=Pseudogracilibacillus sp. SO10305 TaxID=3098292 RepID=UPI00300E2BAC